MKFLLFKLRLAFHLVFFIFRLLANVSNKAKPVILSFFIIGLFAFIGGISILHAKQKPIEVVFVTTTVPKNIELFFAKKMSKEQIKSEIVFLEKVLVTQPQTRDVLFNLSQLYSALGDTQNAEKYKQSAIAIDPNNPIFE